MTTKPHETINWKEDKFNIKWKAVIIEKLFDAQIAPQTIIRLVDSIENILNYKLHSQRLKDLKEIKGEVEELKNEYQSWDNYKAGGILDKVIELLTNRK